MTKEDYELKVEKLDNEINALKNEKSKLKNLYIDANKKYDVGEKVCVLTKNDKEEYAFIKWISIGYKNDIQYSLFKCKKDGTPSKRTLYRYYVKEIKKIKNK